MINNIPRPEYPRPRLVRDNWLNLNGEWQFEKDLSNTGNEKMRAFFNREDFKEKIIVPFAPESKLSGIEYVDFMDAVWYRREFTVPDEWKNGRILIHFGAVDYFSKVWINKQFAGKHTGGYTPFELDITKLITEGTNAVTVYAFDDTRNNLQPTGKQSNLYNNYGCLYTRSTGIWQTVWLEYVPDTYITKVKMTPDVDNGYLNVELLLNQRFDGEVTADVSFEGKPVTVAKANIGGRSAVFGIKIEEPHLWSLESPNLYDVEFTVGEDKVRSYFGMRKVRIRGKAIEINDKPVFQRLVLDQGYYPDGIYTAPADDDLKKDIELSKAAGFNGARLHMKVFEPRTSYWADRLGYLLWGEYPNWGCNEGNPAALLSVLPEWLEAVERDYNSPAIVGWCPFNETGSNPNREITFRTLYNVTRAIDPMRPIIDTSGYTHVKTDVYDVHDYDQNPETFKNRYMPLVTGEGKVFVNNPDVEKYEGQPYFVSEFGGTHWDIDKDGSEGWGYGANPEDLEEALTRIEKLISALLENPSICAFCYTQLTDVMQEKNGIYSFDRRPKFDNERLRKTISAKAAIEK